MKQRVISAIVALIIVIPIMIIGSYAYYVGVGILSIIGYYEMLKVRQREKKIDLSVRIITLVSYLCIVLSAWNKTDFNIDYRLFILNLLVCYLPFSPESLHIIWYIPQFIPLFGRFQAPEAAP